MSEWPEYESHKVVRAAQIIWVERDQTGGVREIVVRPVGAPPDGEARETFWPTVGEMAQKAEVGGWAMLYPDGFRSISPAKQFEDGYTPVEPLGAGVRRLGLVEPMIDINRKRD